MGPCLIRFGMWHLCLLSASCVVASSWARPLKIPNYGTLIDTTVRDVVGSCHVSLVRPTSSRSLFLHLTLCGCGTRAVTRRTIHLLSRAIDASADADRITCVVEMSASQGASLLALPAVARFMLRYRRRLGRVSVLEARGLALNAVRTVGHLQRSPEIRIYHSWDAFKLACTSSPSVHDRIALQLAASKQCRPRRGGPSLHWLSLREWWETRATQLSTGRLHATASAHLASAGKSTK